MCAILGDFLLFQSARMCLFECSCVADSPRVLQIYWARLVDLNAACLNDWCVLLLVTSSLRTHCSFGGGWVVAWFSSCYDLLCVTLKLIIRSW